MPLPLLTTVLGMRTSLDHEKLDVYQDSIRFAACLDVLIAKKLPAQADSGKAILLSVAYLCDAHRRAAACGVPEKRPSASEGPTGPCHSLSERSVVRIVSMLVGLIRSTSSSRVHEDSAEYGVQPQQDRD